MRSAAGDRVGQPPPLLPGGGRPSGAPRTPLAATRRGGATRPSQTPQTATSTRTCRMAPRKAGLSVHAADLVDRGNNQRRLSIRWCQRWASRGRRAAGPPFATRHALAGGDFLSWSSSRVEGGGSTPGGPLGGGRGAARGATPRRRVTKGRGAALRRSSSRGAPGGAPTITLHLALSPRGSWLPARNCRNEIRHIKATGVNFEGRSCGGGAASSSSCAGRYGTRPDQAKLDTRSSPETSDVDPKQGVQTVKATGFLHS